MRKLRLLGLSGMSARLRSTRARKTNARSVAARLHHWGHDELRQNRWLCSAGGALSFGLGFGGSGRRIGPSRTQGSPDFASTQFPGGLRARPVEARPERDAGLIWFVTDVRSGTEHEIEAEHDMCLVFIDAGAKAYLSITARAEVRRDHAKAAEIWKSTDNMW